MIGLQVIFPIDDQAFHFQHQIIEFWITAGIKTPIAAIAYFRNWTFG
jgi:hypothetical protein